MTHSLPDEAAATEPLAPVVDPWAPLPADAGAEPPGAPTGAAAAPAASATPAAAPPSPLGSVHEVVTCPECGAVQEVQLNRRDAADFCHACDYPLFWTPAQVRRERDELSQGESLRRLPGTVGRSTLASVPCPHCRERNTVTAEVCVRCGRSMHPVVEPPPPVPVYVPPPPPPPVEEPEPQRSLWWLWVLLGFVVVAGTVLGVLFYNGTLG